MYALMSGSVKVDVSLGWIHVSGGSRVHGISPYEDQ